MNATHATMLATAAFVMTAATSVKASTLHFDAGAPYLSLADSPFAAHTGSPTFWLEDFEDGLLNSTGLDATFNGSILGPESGSADSVDGDGLGAIDGSGTDGYSLFIARDPASVLFTFDALALGQLPTFAGLVWTDGTATDTIVFEAFDAAGDSLGTISAQVGNPFQVQGDTSEDRFFGITSDTGIGSIRLFRSSGLSGFELDHVQYGYAAAVVPVPPAVGLGMAGLAAIAIRRRRKQA